MSDNWNSAGNEWGAPTTGSAEWNPSPTDKYDGFDNDTNTFNSAEDGFANANAEASGLDEYNEDASYACRNCGLEGHFARECAQPRKLGACFNCGEEGHSKAECTKPKVFNGTCNLCNEEGHPAARCPSKPKLCSRCKTTGDHDTKDCENNFSIDLNDVADVTEKFAWAKIAEACHDSDLDDFKAAIRMLQKAVPSATYPLIEKKLREKGLKYYLIGLKKDIGDGYTLVNLQGEPEKTFSMAIFKSSQCQRPNMVSMWPSTPAENLERLADAGTPFERGLSYCRVCQNFGHASRDCDQERVPVDQPAVTCALCDEEGHRVRDCTQERRKPREPRTCKVCGSEDHLAKECDQKPKFTCRNCGGEDHKAADCTEPRKLICNNCSEEGHLSRECPAPRDWSRVTCKHCGEKGHASATRCAPGAAKISDDNLNTRNENDNVDEYQTEASHIYNTDVGDAGGDAWASEFTTQPATGSNEVW